MRLGVAGLLVLSLAACGPPPAAGPPPNYPGRIRAPEALRGPAGMPSAFMIEQRVSTTTPEGPQEFRAVLQRQPDRVVLLGLAPHGGRGFSLEQDAGEEDVRFTSYIDRELPFPARFIMLDVHRAFFIGLDGPRADGEHTETLDGEAVTERWAAGKLLERRFRRLDGEPPGEIVITYEGGMGAGEAPSRITLDNGWLGYVLDLETLSFQALLPEDTEPE